MAEEINVNDNVSLQMDPESKRLFKVRKVQKGKKPDFCRACHHKFKRLNSNWRRPRGLQGKQRRGYRGKGAVATVGYGSPVVVKGLHPSGFVEVLINNLNELETVVPSFEAIRIGRTVGGKKKALILEKAAELGIKVLNPGNRGE